MKPQNKEIKTSAILENVLNFDTSRVNGNTLILLNETLFNKVAKGKMKKMFNKTVSKFILIESSIIIRIITGIMK